MTKTYSSWPFITLDGPDEDKFRAEVSVVTGFGTVSRIEESESGKAVKAYFKVDNNKYPSFGWLPSESKLLDVLREHEESEDPLYFRIESLRKNHVDRKTPFKEIGKDKDGKTQVFKSLAGIKENENDEWTLNPMAKTRPDEDPKSSNTGGSNANDYSREELAKMGGNSSPAVAASNSFEAPPYRSFNRDGGLNYGSFAVGVPMSILTFVNDYFRDSEEEVDEKNALILAKIMLTVANNAQVRVYNDSLDRPDLTAGSHTRARAIMYEVIRESHPLTASLASDSEERKEWAKNVLQKTVILWQWSAKTASKFIVSDDESSDD